MKRKLFLLLIPSSVPGHKFRRVFVLARDEKAAKHFRFALTYRHMNDFPVRQNTQIDEFYESTTINGYEV